MAKLPNSISSGPQTAPVPEDNCIGGGGALADVQCVSVLGQVDLKLPAVDHMLPVDTDRVATCGTNQQSGEVSYVVTKPLLRKTSPAGMKGGLAFYAL